jgi:hypothetical protein
MTSEPMSAPVAQLQSDAARVGGAGQFPKQNWGLFDGKHVLASEDPKKTCFPCEFS